MDRKVNIEYMDIPESIRNQYQYFTEAKLDKIIKLGLASPLWPLENAVEDYVKNYLLKADNQL